MFLAKFKKFFSKILREVKKDFKKIALKETSGMFSKLFQDFDEIYWTL